jgi:hypothetical protein
MVDVKRKSELHSHIIAKQYVCLLTVKIFSICGTSLT